MGMTVEDLRKSLTAKGKVPEVAVAPAMDGSWSQLAQQILEAEIRDEIDQGVAEQRAAGSLKLKLVSEPDSEEILVPRADGNMKSLAMRLAIPLEILYAMRDEINPEVWGQKKLERVIRMEAIRNRAQNWEEIETVALEKLLMRMQHMTMTEDTLLGIAAAANKMNQTQYLRSESNPNGGAGGNVMVQINNMNSNSPNGDLPGPGNLGSITLSLSKRVTTQLALPKRDVGEDGRFIDSIEMLGAREVPTLLTTDADGNQIVEKEESNENDQ